jgi:hypothetical protein
MKTFKTRFIRLALFETYKDLRFFKSSRFRPIALLYSPGIAIPEICAVKLFTVEDRLQIDNKQSISNMLILIDILTHGRFSKFSIRTSRSQL